MNPQQQETQISEDLEEILDINDLESKIYLNLLRTGPITASALAKEVNVDRARMYRTVEKLITQNIISTTVSSPKLCVATPPEEAIKTALGKKQDEINKIKKTGKTIINKINDEINTTKSQVFPTFRVVQKRQNIYADIEQLIEESHGIVYIATTLEDISKMYFTSIPEKISIAEKNGGDIRLLVDSFSSDLNAYIKRFNATKTRVCELPSKGRIVVHQDTKVILGDTNPLGKTMDEYSLCTNCPDIISNMFSLCSFLWENAQPINTLNVENYTHK